MPDILLIGATGFTGRLTAKYLASHPQSSSFSWGIAGRSLSKLQKLAAELNLPITVEISIADTSDPEQLGNVIKQAKVVIGTVGPFPKYGTPIIRACVEHGVHYVDVATGPHWIKNIIDEFHEKAAQKGTMIVNSCAMVSLPMDLSVHLSRQTLSEYAPGSEIDTSVLAFDGKFTTSGGSIDSLIDLLEASSEEKAVLQTDHALSPVVGAPSPPRRLFHELSVPGEKEIVGGVSATLPFNRSTIQRTAGLLQLASDRHNLPKQILPYGKSFTYDEFAVSSSRLGAVFSGVAVDLLMTMLSFAPVRWAIKKVAPPSGEGASDEELASGKYKIKTVNLTTSLPTPTHPKRTYVKTTVNMDAEAYVVSAACVAESALSIIFNHKSLPEMGKEGGVLTPMAALGNVIIERLKEVAFFTIESTIVTVHDKDL